MEVNTNTIIEKLKPYYEYLGLNSSLINADSIYQIIHCPKLRHTFYSEKILLINMCHVMLTSKLLPDFKYTYNIYQHTRNMDLGEYRIHIRNITNRVYNIIQIYGYSIIMPVVTELTIYQAYIESDRIIDPILKAIVMFAVSVEFV